MVVGPSSVEADEIFRAVRRTSTTSQRYGKTYYDLLSQPEIRSIPTGRYVLSWVESARSDEVDLVLNFCWEFSKLITDKLPNFIYGNESAKGN